VDASIAVLEAALVEELELAGEGAPAGSAGYEGSLMRFEFATATRILFGPGVVAEAAPTAAALGHRAVVAASADVQRSAALLDELRTHGVTPLLIPVAGEPTVDLVRVGLQRAREAGCDLVLGLGGGSVLDVGKAIAALLTNGGDPLDYLEVVGRGKTLSQPSAPYLAIPTTAGTGAEVTRNAVLASPEHRVKASLRSPHLYPRLALVDPELTHSLPTELTASTGLDALTQLIEPFVSTAANPLTDAICREGMRLAARALRRACRNGRDAAAREDMALASLLGGLALANARLGVVHGFAAPLGGRYRAPHGAICARLLPPVMEGNVRALQMRAAGSPTLERYAEVGRILTGRAEASIADGVTWVRTLCADLEIPGLGSYGLTLGDLPALVAETQRASSTKGNPIALTTEELTDIARQAL
jgi:alcohol dehydrogenase class IV